MLWMFAFFAILLIIAEYRRICGRLGELTLWATLVVSKAFGPSVMFVPVMLNVRMKNNFGNILAEGVYSLSAFSGHRHAPGCRRICLR